MITKSRTDSHLRAATTWLVAILGCAGIVSACTTACRSSSIAADERVILFPSVAMGDGASWTGHVAGWIHEPVKGDPLALMNELKSHLQKQFDVMDGDLTGPFADRAGMFFVDNERRKQISVTIGGATFTLGESAPNGHFEGDITLTGTRKSGEWADVQVVTGAGDSRVFAGKVQFIGRRGVSVVSDIDDTIKDSNVLDKRELLLNTFVRDFRPAEGMATLYTGWAGNSNVVFHYVSGSPFQLYPALSRFIEHGFPAGSVHLRPFRLKDSSVREFFGDPLQFKIGSIEPLMARFPERKFVFVGDSGERDAEVYGTLALRFPNQVAAILIRDVGGDGLTSPSVVQLYAKLPTHIRRVFRHPRELEDFKLPEIPAP
jgi:phosphatidate phosphatase APP1